MNLVVTGAPCKGQLGFEVIRTADQPFVGDGIYHVSEYWTPMVAYTVWLMAMLQD